MPETNVFLQPLRPALPGRLELLFQANLAFTSDSPSDAVIPGDDHDAAYIGTGNGTIEGERLAGTVSWSLYAGNCLYPLIRAGHIVTNELNLCTLNPGGFIETDDGARIRFDGRGYGLRSPERYLMSATLAFRTDAAKYASLNTVLAVMQGEFDERAGRATWSVFLPDPVVHFAGFGAVESK
jgi:hypothetical protein